MVPFNQALKIWLNSISWLVVSLVNSNIQYIRPKIWLYLAIKWMFHSTTFINFSIAEKLSLRSWDCNFACIRIFLLIHTFYLLVTFVRFGNNQILLKMNISRIFSLCCFYICKIYSGLYLGLLISRSWLKMSYHRNWVIFRCNRLRVRHKLHN